MFQKKEAPTLPARTTHAETQQATVDHSGSPVANDRSKVAEMENRAVDPKASHGEVITKRIADVDQRWKAADAEFEAELGIILADAKEALGLKGRKWDTWLRANVASLSRDKARALVKQALEARKTAVSKPATLSPVPSSAIL